jgi:dihydroorotate dehydrogenase
LIQLYSGLVYRGIGLVSQIKRDLLAAAKRDGRGSLAAVVGNDAANMTAESWPS